MWTLASMYWKPLALLVVVGAFFAYVGILRHERDSARIDRDQYKAQVAKLTVQAKAWEDTVAIQNKKIDDLNKAYTVAHNRMIMAQQVAKKISLDSESKIQNLRHYYDSIPDSNECQEIKRILDADAPTVH